MYAFNPRLAKSSFIFTEVQDKISEVWDKVDSESIETLGDIKEYWDEFYHMFGFGYENVDYSEDVEI